MGDWRRVTVDDRIPVNAFGAPLLVGSMPSQLWPLILSKAVIKLMASYQVNKCCRLLRSVMLLHEQFANSCTATMQSDADMTMFTGHVSCTNCRCVSYLETGT